MIGVFAYPEQWMVGFAYMAHNAALGWHIRLNYWSCAELDPPNPPATTYTQNDIGWDDILLSEYPAGIPSFDIGPPGSNHGAIAWMQAKTDEWSNCTVMYADSHAGSISYDRIDMDGRWPRDCYALPSVAVHQHIAGNYRASVSLLHSEDYVTNYWIPSYTWIDSIPAGGSAGFGPVIEVIHLITCHGEWDAGAFIEHNYGLSTGLTVYDRNYWMLWSGFDPALGDGGPSSVYGAWGNTD